jgi:hypothetical protein
MSITKHDIFYTILLLECTFQASLSELNLSFYLGKKKLKPNNFLNQNNTNTKTITSVKEIPVENYRFR